MSQHTPGPWNYSGTADGLVWTITLKRGRQSRKIEVEGFTNEEAHGNALLIAAAPDLYQALRDAVAALGGIRSDNVPESVQKALAKAEGRS